MIKVLLALFFLLLDATISHANELETPPIIKRLDKKYLNLIDKNGKITNLKEFNKNGKIIIFENEKEDKNNYLIIVKKNNQFYACDGLIKDFLKNNSKTKCFKKDGNANLDLKNFKMHYIVPLNYGDYWRKLLNITDNRQLTQEELRRARKVHNALPKEVRTKNLDAFVYEKYHLTPEEHMREQAIHLTLKDGIVIYYHHYYADLNKLFKAFDITASHANELENLPIIKRLDEKYLKLIDKNGKITNLKEFNKNGVAVVFEGDGFDTDKQLYMFIENSKSTDKNFNFKGTYTKDLLSDFKKNSYCNNETDEYIIPYVNIKLNLENFTFKEVIFNNFDKKQQKIITKLYNDNDFDKLIPFISGYVQCGIKIHSNKLLNDITKLLKIK